MSPLYNKLHNRHHMGQYDVHRNSRLWLRLVERLDDSFYAAVGGP